MIEFTCKSFDKNSKNPIVSNYEIGKYAESLIADYKPSLLKNPGKINALHFIEAYLKANLEFQDIFHEAGTPVIAGATIFNDERVLVFSKEIMDVKSIMVSEDTIMIDNDTMARGNEEFALFTCLHEAGHFCIHPSVYKKPLNQMSLFTLEEDKNTTRIVMCRREKIKNEYSILYGGYQTPEGTRERQANVFAAYMAMPSTTFVPHAKMLIKELGFSDGIVIEEEVKTFPSDLAAYISTLNAIKEPFGTSSTATEIHMKSHGLYMTMAEYSNHKCKLF